MSLFLGLQWHLVPPFPCDSYTWCPKDWTKLNISINKQVKLAQIHNTHLFLDSFRSVFMPYRLPWSVRTYMLPTRIKCLNDKTLTSKSSWNTDNKTFHRRPRKHLISLRNVWVNFCLQSSCENCWPHWILDMASYHTQDCVNAPISFDSRKCTLNKRSHFISHL